VGDKGVISKKLLQVIQMILDGKRIFLVEDHTGNKAVIKTLLEAHGAEVFSPFVTQHILDTLSKYNPIDLIILDLMLPGETSGFDLFHKLSADSHYRDVPIIATSADRSYMKSAKELGFSGYISKPIRFSQFSEQINRILSGDSIWQ
jgi:two-component system cell cycle response regulator DivK